MGGERELVILNNIAQALNRSVNLDEALQTTLAQVAALFDLQTGWVWLLNEKTNAFYLAAAQNLPPALADNPVRMEGWCYCLESFEEGDLEGAANVNVITCTRLKNLVDGTDGLRYHASIPLYAHGKELGVLNVASTDWRELSADDLRLLYTVGDLLSIAIERARLFARSTELGAAEERNRLAREIHDTLAQGLAAIALQLETADLLLESVGDGQRVRQTVQQALQLTRANLVEARRSVLDLRAAPLEGRTLAEALKGLTQEVTAKHGVAVKFQAVGANRPLPVAIEGGLYRVAQEALTNIYTHARATVAKVDLLLTPTTVQLTIQDDGCGFDPDDVTPNRYGLTGMNERVRLLGGQLQIESALGAGTKVTVAVPLITK
ncbi:MAG: GAF domain-containing sensor histidine kinase [Caldilineaceae bacterium]